MSGNNCRKGNRPCPGYDNDLRFHDEGSKLRKRFEKKETPEPKTDAETPSSSSSGSTLSTISSPDESLDVGGPQRTTIPVLGNVPDRGQTVLIPLRNRFWSLLESPWWPGSDLLSDPNLVQQRIDARERLDGGSIDVDLSFDLEMSRMLFSPNIEQEQLFCAFTRSLLPPGTAIFPQNHMRWLSWLPTLSGTNPLLDSAVRAVSLAHLGQAHQAEVLLHESRPYYGKALRLLGSALNHQEKGMSSETLSATILLSFYEMFSSGSNQSWVRHAGGAAALMRLRGAARHRYGFDREIFLAYRHTIIIDSFQRDQACFLNEPDWLEVSRQIHEDVRLEGFPPDRVALFDLAEEFYVEMVAIPATSRDALSLRDPSGRAGFPNIRKFTQDLAQRVHAHRMAMKSIYTRFRAALKRAGLEPTSHTSDDHVFPLQYKYASVFVGSSCTGYWTILILLNLILKDLEKTRAPERVSMYLAENHGIALECCRSTAYMLTSSFLGPFFVVFALRLCLMVFEHGKERDWVMLKLFEISNTRLKMAGDIPGFEPETNYPQMKRASQATVRLEEI